MTWQWSSWYADRTLLSFALLLTLLGYGFWTALAGKPVFGRDLLEAES